MVLGPLAEWPDVGVLADIQPLKYARRDRALRGLLAGLVRQGIDLLPPEVRDRAVVDVKPYPRIEAGEAPCLIGWHTDCVKHADQPGEEVHALVQFEWPDALGSICPTLFRSGPVPVGQWVTYGREEHTAQRAAQGGSRLLVRVSWGSHFAPCQKSARVM